MTKFGEVDSQLAFTLNVRCKSNGHDGDHEHYKAPDGWIIYETWSEEKTDRGNTLIWDNNIYGESVITLDLVTFEEALRQITGGFSKIILMHNQLAETATNILKAGDYWKNSWKGRAFCDTGPGSTAKFYKNYYVKIMYVGLKSDVYNTLGAWLSGISIEKGFSYETEQNTLGYRCNEHYVRPEDQVIMAHEPPGGHQNPSVFYDTSSHFPAGTQINFKARVASEDPKIPRKFNLAIWQMLDTAKLCGETQQIEVTDWQEIELTYVTQEKGPFRLEVYWHDNKYTNVLIDMKETLVMFRKTF